MEIDNGNMPLRLAQVIQIECHWLQLRAIEQHRDVMRGSVEDIDRRRMRVGAVADEICGIGWTVCAVLAHCGGDSIVRHCTREQRSLRNSQHHGSQ